MTSFRRPTRRIGLLLAVAMAVAIGSAGVSQKSSQSRDQSFTIAVIPDTQNYVDYTHQSAEGFAFDASKIFLEQMTYIAANVESAGGDIAFVTSLGDVWQHQTMSMDPDHVARGFKRVPNPRLDDRYRPTEEVKTFEMPLAREGYKLIAGRVPFSVVPGNHDHDAMWTDSSHPPDPRNRGLGGLGMLHAGGTSNFVSVFGKDTPFFKGKKWYVASFNGGANSAQIFTAGGYRFLHIGLQFDPPDKALAWAASVIRRHAGLPTIISTHDYLDNAGLRVANPNVDNHAADPNDNNPQMIWDKLISQHDQIFMVLCGHESGQAFRTDDNRFGHKVYQLLSDYQSRMQTAVDAGVKAGAVHGIGDGWMRLMTFDMAGAAPVVRVVTYSTHYKAKSRDTVQYGAWYRQSEKPRLTDAQFHDQDDFSFALADFRARFDRKARLR